jgi:carotenoid cleavage dioxygenase-like enzyme
MPDKSTPWDRLLYISRVMGGRFPPYNALAKIEVATGKYEVFSPDPRCLAQDPVFIPNKAAKGGE